MVGSSDEVQGTSKATVTTEKAQQILQAYQAYKQSGGNPAPVSAPKPSPTNSPQISISQTQLQKTNAQRAEQDLPPLETVSNVKVIQPTRSSYPTGPQPEKIVTQSKQEPTISATPQQLQIQKTQQTINQISSDFTAAKNAGVTKIDVLDSSGKIIGSVNPQNVSQARLQYLNLTKQGAAQYSYQVPGKAGTNGVTSSLTTYEPKDVLTSFAGGALGSFAEAGLIGLGLVAKLTGKSITVPGTNYTTQPTGIISQAETKVQKTFGRETLDKMLSGEKVDLSNPIALASLAGFGTSIIATGGTGGIKAAISAPSKIVQAIRSPMIAKTIATQELQEGSSLYQLAKVKGSSGTFEFEQASIQKSAKLPDVLKVERLPNGKVQAVKVPQQSSATEATKEPEIPYGVIGTEKAGVTSLVTKVTNLTPQEVAIKGLPLEVGVKMGLERLPETGSFPVFKGKLTSKNIPILLEEIRTGNITPTFDILQYPTKDIAKGGGRYGLLSRNPEMLSSNAFERVTRPNVIRYFESKVELEKEIKPQTRSIKPQTGTGGFSGGGKQTLVREERPTVQKLSKEEKSLVQTVTKKEIQKQSIPLKSEVIKTSTKQSNYSGLRTQIKTENGQQTVQKQKPTGSVPPKIVQRQQTIRQETTNPLLVKTKPKQSTALIQGQSTKPKQSTRQANIPQEPFKGSGKPDIPDKKRNPFGGLPGFTTQSGALGKVSKGGNRLGYIGNVPLSNIVGMYNRSEVTYGNASRNIKSSTPKGSNKYNSLSSKSKSPKII